MKREIQTTKEVEETVEVTICDRCGHEADSARTLSNHHDASVEAQSLFEARTSSRYRPASLTTTDVRQILRKTFEKTSTVHVCENCYEEMFGWRNDD